MRNLQSRTKALLGFSTGLLGLVGFSTLVRQFTSSAEHPFAILSGGQVVAFIVAIVFWILSLAMFAQSLGSFKPTKNDKFERKTLVEWDNAIAMKLSVFELFQSIGFKLLGLSVVAVAYGVTLAIA